MRRSRKERAILLSRGMIAGLALVLVVPVLWLAIPPTADHFQVLARPGPAAVSAAGTWSSNLWQPSRGATGWPDAAYIEATNTVVVGFASANGNGEILFVGGRPLAQGTWVYDPPCNPRAAVDRPGTPQAIILCQSSFFDPCTTAQLLELNTTTQSVDRSVPLPSGCFYDLQIAYDGRADLAYVIEEPTNLSSPAHLLGVNPDSGEVVTNVSVTSSGNPWGQRVALGRLPGTVYFVDDRNLALELLNASTGLVAHRYPIPNQTTSVWSDPITGLVFLALYPYSSPQATTDVLFASNLTLARVIPADSQGGVISDPGRGETYFVGLGYVGVVKTEDWTSLGSVALPTWSTLPAYDPVTDQFAGGVETFTDIGYQVTSVARFSVLAPGFSAVPVVGATLPEIAAATCAVVGVVFLEKSWSGFAAAWRAREDAGLLRLESWLKEREDRAWPRDPPQNNKP